MSPWGTQAKETRPMQPTELTNLDPRVDVRAATQKQSHDVHLAALDGCHEWRFARLRGTKQIPPRPTSNQATPVAQALTRCRHQQVGRDRQQRQQPSRRQPGRWHGAEDQCACVRAQQASSRLCSPSSDDVALASSHCPLPPNRRPGPAGRPPRQAGRSPPHATGPFDHSAPARERKPPVSPAAPCSFAGRQPYSGWR